MLQYGPVMSVGLGTDVWVVLSGLEAIRDFSMREEAVARPDLRIFDEVYSFDKPLGKTLLGKKKSEINNRSESKLFESKS